MANLILCVGLVVCVVIFIPTSWRGAEIDRFDYAKELVFHVAVLSAAVLCWFNADRIGWSLFDLTLLGFVAWGIVAAITGDPPNPWTAWRSVALSMSAALACWTARSLSARGHGRSIAIAIAIAVTLGAIAVLVEAQGGPGASLQMRGPSGTQGVRNFAGHLIVLGLPTLGWFVLTSTTTRRTALLAGAGVACCVAALILTRSRASWLATMVLVGVAIILRVIFPRSFAPPNRRRWRFAILLGGAALGAAFAILCPQRLTWKTEHPYLGSLETLVDAGGGTGRGRVLQYRNTLQMVKDSPAIGVGPGQWGVFYPLYAPPNDPTYKPRSLWNTPARSTSDWLGFAAERGLPGALLLVGVLIFAITLWVRQLARGVAPERQMSAICTCVAVAVIGVFDCPLQMVLPTFVLFSVIGSSLPSSTRWELALPRPARLAGAIVSLLLIGSFGWFYEREIRALRLATSARNAMEWETVTEVALGNPRMELECAAAWFAALQPERGIVHAERALQLNPNLAAARAMLSMVAPTIDPE